MHSAPAHGMHVPGTMLFLVIILLGTGWSLLKPFLSDREKKIFLTVLPLQVCIQPQVYAHVYVYAYACAYVLAKEQHCIVGGCRRAPAVVPRPTSVCSEGSRCSLLYPQPHSLLPPPTPTPTSHACVHPMVNPILGTT